LHPRAVSFPTGETARRARTCRMWRIRATVAADAAVKTMGVGIWYADGMAPRRGFEPQFTAPKAIKWLQMYLNVRLRCVQDHI
jgi:hypothetical protein